MQSPIPGNETARLAVLESYHILDTLPEQVYDDLARLTAQVCGVKIAMVAFLDTDRKWHKARHNIDKLEMPRNISICAHTIMGTEPLIVEDTQQHPVISNVGVVVNPPHLRFYAGVPLIDEEGFALGTLCAVDTVPHSIDEEQVASLVALGRQACQLLKLRKNILMLQEKEQELEQQQTLLNKANQKLRQLSATDYLTDLLNRRSMEEALIAQVEHAKRHGSPLSLLVIDIDKFKQINDKYGHTKGDEILISLASLIHQTARAGDRCARYGGEEFVVIMPETNLAEAKIAAERYRQQAAETIFADLKITISIGVAEYDYQSNSHAFFERADQALFDAKNKGRNCISSAAAQ